MSTFELICGDALKSLVGLPAASIDLCVTSPPYWSMRDYGVGGQIGVEPTPDAYIDAIVGVFGEVKRVLKPSGVLWLNIGDAYITNWPTGANRKSSWWSSKSGDLEGKGLWNNVECAIPANSTRRNGLGVRVKEVCGLPWRIALRLQAEQRWFLRADNVWYKPNAGVKPVRDRPSVVHEYLFMLTKSSTYYHNPANVKGMKSVHVVKNQPYDDNHCATFPEDLVSPLVLAYSPDGGSVLDPFSGYATTGVVAVKHGRTYTGIDIHPGYVSKSRERLIMAGGVARKR
jgi:DNA modification methylase